MASDNPNMVSDMLLIGRMFLIAAAIALAVMACTNEKEQLTAALNDCRNESGSLQSDNNQLQAQVSRLNGDYEEMLAEYENLNVQHKELTAWSQQLAERFGPSVWFFGKDEKPLPVESLPDATPAQLIEHLNRRLKSSELPTVVLTRLSEGIAFVRIPDETQLTQNMGTTGATGYIQSVTYTLTSLPAINQVDFDFLPGDHAMPGRYSR